ncbi:MAG TPA: alpha/beta fold hydrolase [Haliangiales bacterium]|nr:alpha/beta fold hydrolase [Haliangiales bacterium]
MTSLQVPLAYEGRGTSGPPLLLIHGFPLDRSMWSGQLEGLAPHARVVAVDLSGFGTSPARPDDTPFTVEEMAEQVLALADALGFDRFVAGGLSMGGYVVFALLRLAPERIAGVLLCDTRAEPDAPETRKQRLADAEKVLAQGTGFLVERSVRGLLSADTQVRRRDLAVAVEVMVRRASAAGVAQTLRGLAERPDARPELRDIAVPTLVVVGADDSVTPPASCQAMAALIPGAELAVIAGAGHVAPFEAVEPTNVLVRKLLRRVDAAAITAAPPAPLSPARLAARAAEADYELDEPTIANPPGPRKR